MLNLLNTILLLLLFSPQILIIPSSVVKAILQSDKDIIFSDENEILNNHLSMKKQKN